MDGLPSGRTAFSGYILFSAVINEPAGNRDIFMFNSANNSEQQRVR
jgi:hypothetical protein